MRSCTSFRAHVFIFVLAHIGFTWNKSEPFSCRNLSSLLTFTRSTKSHEIATIWEGTHKKNKLWICFELPEVEPVRWSRHAAIAADIIFTPPLPPTFWAWHAAAAVGIMAARRRWSYWNSKFVSLFSHNHISIVDHSSRFAAWVLLFDRWQVVGLQPYHTVPCGVCLCLSALYSPYSVTLFAQLSWTTYLKLFSSVGLSFNLLEVESWKQLHSFVILVKSKFHRSCHV